VMVVNDKAIAIFNIDNQLFAIEDCCTHQGLPLSDGYVEGNQITCPFHGAQFCLKTGDALSPPAFEKLNTFETRIKDNLIQINLAT
jgi:3-phenylpropionate/trans-cinnamate dioxygenase ferredoxin subunit